MSVDSHGQEMLATAPMGISGHWRRRSSSEEESERITVASAEQPSEESVKEGVVFIGAKTNIPNVRMFILYETNNHLGIQTGLHLSWARYAYYNAIMTYTDSYDIKSKKQMAKNVG